MPFLDTAVWFAITAVFLVGWAVLIAVLARIGKALRGGTAEVFQFRLFREYERFSGALRWLTVGQFAGFLATAPWIVGLATTPLASGFAVLAIWVLVWTGVWSIAVSLGNVWVARAFGGPGAKEGGTRGG